jgi:hypothetical protein
MMPSGYRVPNKSGNSAVHCKSAGNRINYLLFALTSPTESKILLDPGVWIADTGASIHMMTHRKGLIDVRRATTAEMITMGNGIAESTAEIITLPGTVCDQYGNKLNKVAIDEVSYFQNGTFSLISLM